jgi:hypothetical protein
MKVIFIILGIIFFGNIINGIGWSETIKRIEDNRDE